MRLSNRVVLATLNRNKFEEFRSILKTYPEIELVPAEELLRNAENLQFVENYATYLDNAVAKARLCNLGTHYPSLADDSGLEVTALDGRPGPMSHRYAPPQPKKSQDQANVELLLKEIKSASLRSARFVCTVVLVIEGILIHSTGTLEGSIAEEPRGQLGFGYDPVFVPAGEKRTLAEMTAEEKNKISHRAKAIHQLMLNVKAHGISFAKP
jgi:XTP/dITP diphosphohydrolase